MRSKHIIALATFFTCFAVSSFFVELLFDKNTVDAELYEIVTVRPQTNDDAREKILALFQQDEANGDYRDARLVAYLVEDEGFLSLAEKTEIFSEYAADSAAIDDGGLPRDFQIAWRKHMDAWDDYSNFLQKAENAGVSVESFNRVEPLYDYDIDSTWDEVLRVGGSYGAEFSD